MNAQRERVVRRRGARAAADAAAGDVSRVLAAVAEWPRGRWLLAVSGGRDSMALLHAMAAVRAGEVAAVATFDHGTGPSAARAALLVEREAGRLGFRVVSGSASPGLSRSEHAWRHARHAFLDIWAEELGATVMTAHTRDDEIETVVLRLLRGAGPRGLAGMRAGAEGMGARERARPLLGVPRAALAAYAEARGVPFVEDPSNADPAFQRNRVRHELLPALERAAPGFGEWCWSLGARAAAWRARMDDVVRALGVQPVAPGSAMVPAAAVAGCTAREWAVLWPAIAARAGVVMDRRGIARAAEWAPRAKAGQTIQLAGDARIDRTASTFVVRGDPVSAPEAVPGTTEAASDYILEQ